jgi:hypothetical protein
MSSDTAGAESRDPSDIFANTLKGRFPLSKNIGSARFWTPKQPTTIKKGDNPDSCEERDVGNALGIPRPNVELGWLRLLSAIGGIFGLDHFYANSPVTGVAKLLTLGGFGLWWIWDNLQLWLESDKVLNYGMMPLFDMRLHDPVAQGMIVDGDCGYERTNFSVWTFSELFLSLFGINQIFLGKAGLFFFHLLIFVLPFILTVGYAVKDGWSAMTIVLTVIYTFFGLFHVGMWFQRIRRILTEPEKLFGTDEGGGLHLYPVIDKMVNPYARALKVHDIRPTSLYTSQTGEKLRDLFRIRAIGHETSDIECDTEGSALTVFYESLLLPFEKLRELIVGIFSWMFPGGAEDPATQGGGGYSEPLSTESLVLGGTLIALMMGGGIKAAVNTFVAAPQ